MTDAVIVSTARTPFAKSWRGALNMTYGATLGAHVVREAVVRAGIDPAEGEDVIMGCALAEGTTGGNIARQIALCAGLPVSTAGVTVNRLCSSGLQAIAMAATRVMRESGPASQQRAAKARADGRFEAEIVPTPVTMGIVAEAANRIGIADVTLKSDEGIRPDTTLEGVSKIRPALPGGVVAAGNASQFCDGASACVVMDAKLAERRGLSPLGIFRGFAVAGCEPDEMGIGPVFAVPRLLDRTGVRFEDVDLWELNEAFAVQVIYCRESLGIPPEKLNVNGGAIALGHPYG